MPNDDAWQQIVSTLYDKGSSTDDKDRAWWTIAEFVRRHLHRYNKPAYPRMPATLPEDDEILRVLEKRGKRNAAERQTVGLFNAWRMAFWRQENEAAARAYQLLAAAWTMHRLGIEDHRDELLRHLEDQFDYKGGSEPPSAPEAQRRAARRLTIDASVLSADLRNGRRQTAAQDQHPEDDDGFFEKLGEFGDG